MELRDGWTAKGGAEGLFCAVGSGGLFGVVSYLVALRRREIGVRLALGARPAEVLVLVLRQGLAIVGPGLVLGLLGALATTRVLGTQLYEVSTSDPGTLLAAAGCLAAVSAAATWLPARRAARVAPMEALRSE